MKYAKIVIVTVTLGIVWAAVWFVIRRGDSSIALKKAGTAVELSVDLGEIYMGQDAAQKLSIRNRSAASILLRGEAGCACTSVKLDRTALNAGEASGFEVRYQSAKRPNRIGKVQERFAVSDISTSPSIAKLIGTIDVFVKPSVTLTPASLERHLGPDGPEPKETPVTVKNETGAPLTFRWQRPDAAHGAAFVYVVTPEQLTIQPGEQKTITVSAVKLSDSQPYAGKVEFVSELQEGSKPLKLSHQYSMRIVPRTVVAAIPGSLIFTSNYSPIQRFLRIAAQFRRVDRG